MKILGDGKYIFGRRKKMEKEKEENIRGGKIYVSWRRRKKDKGKEENIWRGKIYISSRRNKEKENIFFVEKEEEEIT